MAYSGFVNVKHVGKVAWKSKRNRFALGLGASVVWEKGGEQLVVCATQAEAPTEPDLLVLLVDRELAERSVEVIKLHRHLIISCNHSRRIDPVTAEAEAQERAMRKSVESEAIGMGLQPVRDYAVHGSGMALEQIPDPVKDIVGGHPRDVADDGINVGMFSDEA